MVVRAMATADLQAVAAIEGWWPSPWTGEMLQAELQTAGGVQLVAIAHGVICGWLACRALPPEAELLKIAVLPEARRQGLASALLAAALAPLQQQGCKELFLEVRVGNHSARGFYRQLGFIEVGLRRGYYQNPTEDALLMKRIIVTNEAKGGR